MKFIALCSLFICLTTNAQDKKEYFYDENDVAISEVEFASKIDYKINIDRVFTSDTAVIARLYTRKTSGELQPEAMEYLKKYLATISGRELDTAKVIVINYFPGEENTETELSHAYLYNKDYTKKLNKITPNEQFWIYKSDKNLEHHHGKRLNWKYDKIHYIENTFFPAHFNFGSYVVIHPNGKFIKYYGEYGKNNVWETAKEIVNLYGN